MSLLDKQLQQLLEDEVNRQRDGLELIASENYVSKNVLEALGSVYTNKYSEGYPNKRYYGGQENTDKVEQIAIDRAKKLFGSDHANVQPYSGAPANMAVYHAWLNPGDTILAMKLDQGGHLTHGHPVTTAGKIFNFVRYGIKNLKTGELDYNELRSLALKYKPKIILAGFSAYPRELDYQKFADIAKEVNALAMADIAHIAGLIAGGVAKNPMDFGFNVMTSTTHKTLRGPRGGLILTRGDTTNPLKAPEHDLKNLPTIIDRSVFPGYQGGPHMNNILAKAVAFGEALQPEFKSYVSQVVDNAKVLADELIKLGFKLVTNGTDNHLILADVYSSFKIDGSVVESALDSIGLTVNKNVVPNDSLPPFKPSGIRIGTPAITTRGLKTEHMSQLAKWIKQAIDFKNDSKKLKSLRYEIKEFCQDFPLPSDR